MREVAALPLPPTVRQKLQASGFHSVIDLNNINPVDLSKEAHLTHEEALSVLTAVHGADIQRAVAGAKSASNILREEQARRVITTGAAELDALLGGGVAPQEVTEFCGVPGIGKTQLGMQLAVNVQIPHELGGVGGHAIYIDTEGSLIAERVVDMAHALVGEVSSIAAASNNPQKVYAAKQLTVDSVLANMHYFRVHTATEQRALLNSLEKFLNSHQHVRLVVIDSIAFHFRQDFPDMSQRTRILNESSLLLMRLADKFSLAIVSINQVTTKVSTDGPSMLVPALGESFAHACTTRVILHWQQDHTKQRYAHLYKSPRLPQSTAPFRVEKNGIRGLAGSSYTIHLGGCLIGQKRPYGHE
mmetsp:Transcript_3991/g.7773  ORF Transcript_3991/g.7773 Transcript_3991/m.7773 type:complete len:359 (-) Transcript_3991:99-1175(-)|eukprot:CAMPEP_0114224674 /NCGR_PEP_ID=MMETSP0058-20121206/239_1 /TAXON_ID=36894 /ORGANISM="Pyramimonas parkeae, CCMP726" /LENGTH=358 /DNA_ID=CAMNT_0001335177 /DNA_START=309 /DNA_END=1385 /DNA_ORIENTATION=+